MVKGVNQVTQYNFFTAKASYPNIKTQSKVIRIPKDSSIPKIKIPSLKDFIRELYGSVHYREYKKYSTTGQKLKLYYLNYLLEAKKFENSRGKVLNRISGVSVN